jgi:hypothetical protein
MTTDYEVLGADMIGKTITALTLDEHDALCFVFDDGKKMRVRDEGHECCEDRYMRTDDALDDYLGAKFIGMVIKDAPDQYEESDPYGEPVVHEVQFLEVRTDRGVLTMASHNEHNGYYGGFWIKVEVQ